MNVTLKPVASQRVPHCHLTGRTPTGSIDSKLVDRKSLDALPAVIGPGRIARQTAQYLLKNPACHRCVMFISPTPAL
jgi:hypothetical protein